MNQDFTEIRFENNHSRKSHFDLVSLEGIFQRKPTDHSQFEYHKLSFFVILICTDNEGQYNVNFKDYTLKKGSLFTLRKDNIHKFYKSEAKGLLLVFTVDFILNNSNRIDSSKTFLLFNEMLASPHLQLNKNEYKDITIIIDLIKEEYLKNNDVHSKDIIRSYLQVITTKLFRIKSKTKTTLRKHKYLPMFLQFQELVEKDCFNHKKVAYYAKQLAVTAKTLNNVTQSIIHKSAKVFINEIVIIQSKRIIANSNESLTEIAFKVGFNDPTNFFKYFRKYTGLSPSQFRKSCQ